MNYSQQHSSEQESVIFNKKIPVKEYCDVLVVGGGPAGVIAAVSAAREGSRTVLAERFGSLGGMMTAGHVDPILGAVSGGTMADEFISRMRTVDGDIPPHVTRNGEEIAVDRETARLTMSSMLREAGVTVLLTAAFVDVIGENGSVSGCIFSSQDGLFAVKAGTTVDCTGAGCVAAAAGADYGLGIMDLTSSEKYKPSDDTTGSLQPMTIEFTVANVDESIGITAWGGTDPVKLPAGEFAGTEYRELCKLKNREGELPKNVSIVRLHRTTHPGERSVNATQANGFDPLNPSSLGLAEAELREQTAMCVSFLRKYVPGFENCILKTSADTVGIRESRRIRGLETVVDSDVETGRERSDAVVHRAWFLIDIHNPKGGGQAEGHSKQAVPYDIPYGAMVPAGTKGLLVAGRCISGTHRAHASYRVMKVCMALGEAAGIAAAISSGTDRTPSLISPDEIRKVLISRGVGL
ncbi:MAG: FAD-dependent oxidoreductase [Clostridia bacterium]|nr:FAD-dependent oxidoreductase [Clostridia bacterium]